MALSITQSKPPPCSFFFPPQCLVLRHDQSRLLAVCSLSRSQDTSSTWHLPESWRQIFLCNNSCNKESMIKISFTKCINSQAKIKSPFDSNRFSMVSQCCIEGNGWGRGRLPAHKSKGRWKGGKELMEGGRGTGKISTCESDASIPSPQFLMISSGVQDRFPALFIYPLLHSLF